jgi:RNA-binding protein YlmH
MRNNVPANSQLLSLAEQQMCQYLFGDVDGLYWFGGYDEAERKMLVFLPEYIDEEFLCADDSPIACLRAAYYEGDEPTHRDFLGALMGLGIARETIGDICISSKSCDLFVTREIAPFLLQNLTGAGRAKLHLSAIALSDAVIPEPEIRIIKDTLASMRLDGVISAGFRISRGAASQYIAAGKAAVDGMPCEKSDKSVSEGAKISVRGLGKIHLAQVNGQTKKGRISVVIHRYV